MSPNDEDDENAFRAYNFNRGPAPERTVPRRGPFHDADPGPLTAVITSSVMKRFSERFAADIKKDTGVDVKVGVTIEDTLDGPKLVTRVTRPEHVVGFVAIEAPPDGALPERRVVRRRP